MNTNTRIGQTGDPVATRDGRFIAKGADGRYKIMGGGMRDELIDPNFRIRAEPAPPGPDRGFTLTGEGPERAEGDDDAAGLLARAAGLLSQADYSAVSAIFRKYGASGRVSNAGIASSDQVSQARRAVADVRRGVDSVRSINESNAAFWRTRIESSKPR